MSEGVKDKCSSREEIEKATTETLFGTSVNEKSIPFNSTVLPK